MLALLTTAEVVSLREHINASPIQLANLHTRNYHMKNKKRVMRHLHAMILKSGVFQGYVNGPAVDFEYEIDAAGVVTFIRTKLSMPDTLQYFKRFIKREILKRVTAGHADHTPQLTPGHYYLRRTQDAPKVTKAAKRAVIEGLLTSDFVQKTSNWNLKLIRGGGA